MYKFINLVWWVQGSQQMVKKRCKRKRSFIKIKVRQSLYMFMYHR